MESFLDWYFAVTLLHCMCHCCYIVIVRTSIVINSGSPTIIGDVTILSPLHSFLPLYIILSLSLSLSFSFSFALFLLPSSLLSISLSLSVSVSLYIYIYLSISLASSRSPAISLSMYHVYRPR